MVHEGLLHLGLAARIGGAEEVEEGGVFEKLGGHVRIRRWHGEGKVVLRLACAEVQAALDLHFQDAATPAVGECLADVEGARCGGFDPLHHLENMSPWQLRNSLLRNWAIGEFPGEYLHGQQVARRQAAHVGEGFLKVGGKAVDDSGSPRGLLLPGEDDLPSLPAGFDDDGIGRF